MPVVRLTAKERILIHLADFAKFAQTMEVPPDMGQDGIARAAGIYVQHVRQFINPLLKDGLVRERVAHVKGHRRRLKVYDLTDSGRLAAARLREQVRAKPIRVRDAGGMKETTVGEALREAGGRATLVDIVREAGERDIVDLPALQAGPTAVFVERLAEAPRLRAFVGRLKELEALTREADGARLSFVRGVAGIGKSSLAAKACERLRGTRNLYWHRIRSWDTRLSMLAGLAEFLAVLGRPGLRAVLARGDSGTADQVVREDLPGTRSVLVFDDAHDAAPEVLRLLRFLKEVLAEAVDLSMIVLSRRTLPIYDRRDVAIHGLVQEIDLGGLAPEEIAALLAEEPGSSRLQDAARKFGGHPLFLELMRSTTQRGLAAESLTDVQRFVEEEIYTELTEPERRMMKTAALYAVPFPREVLFADPSMSHDILLSLTAKSLVRPVADDTFGVHDTIRDFFASILTPHERETLAPVAADHLLRLSEKATAAKDFVATLNCLSNALELAPSHGQQAAVCEALGDTYERIGDFPAALTSYREAVRRTEEPENLARLHRKTAAALQVRGEMAPAIAEIEAGFDALGLRPSVERGWLNFVQCRVALEREEWTEAREYAEAALTAFQSAGDAIGQARTLLELANVQINAQGNPAEAEGYLTSALELSDAVGEPEFRARVHIVLANLYANRIGDIDRATHHIEAVEAIQDSITDPHVRRSFLFLEAWFALYQRADFRAAGSWFTQALVLARRIHAHSSLAFAKYGLAHVQYFDGRIEEARRAFEECVVEIDARRFSGYAMEARWMVAECCLRLEDLPSFLRIVKEYRDPRLSAGVAARPFHARVLEGLDRLVHGDRAGCEAAFMEALHLIETRAMAPDAALAAFVHLFYGVALRAMGRNRPGKEQLQRAVALLEAGGLNAQLLVVRAAEPQLVNFLRRAYASETVGLAR